MIKTLVIRLDLADLLIYLSHISKLDVDTVKDIIETVIHSYLESIEHNQIMWVHGETLDNKSSVEDTIEVNIQSLYCDTLSAEQMVKFQMCGYIIHTELDRKVELEHQLRTILDDGFQFNGMVEVFWRHGDLEILFG